MAPVVVGEWLRRFHKGTNRSIFQKNGYLLSGDTLFIDAIGRPESWAALLYRPLQRLLALPDDTFAAGVGAVCWRLGKTPDRRFAGNHIGANWRRFMELGWIYCSRPFTLFSNPWGGRREPPGT